MDERESAEKRRKRKEIMDTVMEFMITAYIDGVATYEEVEIMADIWRDIVIE